MANVRVYDKIKSEMKYFRVKQCAGIGRKFLRPLFEYTQQRVVSAALKIATQTDNNLISFI